MKSKLKDTQTQESHEESTKVDLVEGSVSDENARARGTISMIRRGEAPAEDFPPGHEAFLGGNPEEKVIARKSIGKRMAISVGGALVLAVLFFVIPRLWSYFGSYESTDDAQIDGHVNPISSRIDGTVVKVYVHQNQEVAAGARLVDIDPRDQQVAVELARADYMQAQANAATARRDYEAAIARIEADEAANARAQNDAARYRALFGQKVVSRAEYDQAISVARVDAAQVAVERANAASADRTIAARDAGVASAKAKLDQALLNLSYTTLTAPVGGVVGKKTVEIGQRVQPGEQMMAIIPLDDIWVTANFKETQLRHMHHGQSVTIYVDAVGRDYRGYVDALAGASGEKFSLLPAENATGNYVKVVQRFPVRIRLGAGQNQDRWLRPGMSVEPTVWLR